MSLPSPPRRGWETHTSRELTFEEMETSDLRGRLRNLKKKKVHHNKELLYHLKRADHPNAIIGRMLKHGLSFEYHSHKEKRVDREIRKIERELARRKKK